MKLRAGALFLFVSALILAGCMDVPPMTAPGASTRMPINQGPGVGSTTKTDPAITSILFDVLEHKNRLEVNLSTIATSGTPLGDILTIGTPTGYALRNRYLNLGIPLTEALVQDPDPSFRERLITLARWDNNNEVRANALVALAGFHDPAHLDVFREALVHLNPGVRFAAMDALIIWNIPNKSQPLLAAAAEKDPEPILRVYAAGGLAKLGDSAGLNRLRVFLDDGSWLVRAMAGRYLGDYGTAEDYTLLVSRMGNEQQNDFVIAEYCIAALKLFPKKRGT